MRDKYSKHLLLWVGLERFAQSRNLSCSALAKISHMNSTSFNPSKRWTDTDKPRWLSTQSISKILDATGATIEEFISFIPRSHSELQ